jgi:hypothetical protein
MSTTARYHPRLDLGTVIPHAAIAKMRELKVIEKSKMRELKNEDPMSSRAKWNEDPLSSRAKWNEDPGNFVGKVTY